MKPALRRHSRRAQPDRAALGLISHTSTSAALVGAIQLSTDYLAVLHDSVRLTRAEQDIWTSGVLSVANQARETAYEARRAFIDEASHRLENQRQEQQQALAQRDAERRARAVELEARQRQEEETARREHEEAERRQREEQVAAEEAHRRAVEEAERRRRERLRACVICMDDHDLSLMAQTPCSHWACRTCLRGRPP
ncbi:Nn.00g075700.m01.CDS01 [Neocucurbitaria sp. VM-36]